MARLRRARLPAVPRSMPRQYRAVSPSGVTEQGAAQIRLQGLKGVRGGRSLRAQANRARQLRTAPTTPSGYRLTGWLQATFRHRTHGDRRSRTLPARSYSRHQRKVWCETDVTGVLRMVRPQEAEGATVQRSGTAWLQALASERVLPLRSNTAQRAMRLRSRQQRNASPG